ncbi:MAG: hypothetical protein GY756_14375 [bacterium]|nr:hypothetical protein [bacterium]
MDDIWKKHAIWLLKSEIKEAAIGYSELSEKLRTIGVTQSSGNISRKINNGGFSTAFLIQCLYVLKVNDLDCRFDKVTPKI